ncbi:MAG TPA: tRNA (cytidine(34)-2'-O)-methyltransferase [Amphiplicatus sp.]|nr:tRNA (cytidine(34)-2'-O)-methyltransferase [Amphiplicatus sp.]
MRIVLVEPDIPQNVGAAIRAAACFGAPVEIIEPCGFPLDSREVRRVAMDYGLLAPPLAHSGWRAFQEGLKSEPSRLVLLTTKGAESLWDFRFAPDDTLLLGRESAGVPEEIHAAADARIRIPMAEGARSLNVATAGAIALAEARRQLGWVV